jgi:dTDP-4-dehydrorhamnose reductase
MAEHTREMMKKDILVIGSSGYLGQQVTSLFDNRAIPIYRTTPKFPDSLQYDLYQDEKLPIDTSEKTIVFTAAVEMNQPIDKLRAGMERLLTQVSDRRFVYISSDAIFSGKKGNYSELDTPDPVNDYGQNLVLCEQLVQSIVQDYCIVRPSYIFGFVNGQLDARLARTRDALESGDKYIAYNDYYKCPLSVHELADAIVYLTDSNYQGPIHVVGKRISTFEFHQQAMEALDVNTSRLLSEPIPKDANLMQDTSLDSSRWWEMRNSSPLSITDALQIGRNGS